MSRNRSLTSVHVITNSVLQVEWRMRFRDGVETVWLWQVQGAPPLDQLAPRNLST